MPCLCLPSPFFVALPTTPHAQPACVRSQLWLCSVPGLHSVGAGGGCAAPAARATIDPWLWVLSFSLAVLLINLLAPTHARQLPQLFVTTLRCVFRIAPLAKMVMAGRHRIPHVGLRRFSSRPVCGEGGSLVSTFGDANVERVHRNKSSTSTRHSSPRSWWIWSELCCSAPAIGQDAVRRHRGLSVRRALRGSIRRSF